MSQNALVIPAKAGIHPAVSPEPSLNTPTKRLVLRKIFLLLWLAPVFILLTSCGFHLRGAIDIPPWLNQLSIVVQNGHRDLDPLLRQRLQVYNITISAPTLSRYWLVIKKDAFQQQIKSVSSSTTPRQYQLIYTVWFSLEDMKGKHAMPASKVVVTRQITVNSDRILGSDDEEAITKGEMMREAVIQILYQISQTKRIAHDH